MLPHNLKVSIESTTKLYTYGDVAQLVAFALIPANVREGRTIEYFKERYPDVFDQKIIDADRLISFS